MPPVCFLHTPRSRMKPNAMPDSHLVEQKVRTCSIPVEGKWEPAAPFEAGRQGIRHSPSPMADGCMMQPVSGVARRLCWLAHLISLVRLEEIKYDLSWRRSWWRWRC